MAATAAAAWIGATAMPWPKAMVIVLISLQWDGTIGAALSGSSVRSRSVRPIRLRKALWPGTPTPSAILAEPMFEECVNTSGMVMSRLVPWYSWIFCRPKFRTPPRVSNVELTLYLPDSSAMASVIALKVEPIS